MPGALGWAGIVRLGLVQSALGAIVVLTTSTMNRVMVVELALPAVLPGVLVAIHYAVQMLRPRMGFGSDVGGRRTPWIVGGIGVLGVGALGAALAIALMQTRPVLGIALAALSFVLVGLGVGAAGTTLLVLLAKRVDERRRAAAATLTWVMMICGFILTTAVAGQLLDPFTPARLVAITAGTVIVALLVTILAVWGIEPAAPGQTAGAGARPHLPSAPVRPPLFGAALRQVWAEPLARQFSIFVFISMLAYNLQDLILEPYAGLLFGFTPGQSTALSSVQHSGVLLGMLCVAVACSVIGGRLFGSMRMWIVGGCIASAGALLALAVGGLVGPGWPLRSAVFALGAANGAFAVAAIGSMMGLAAKGAPGREGLRMGLWGAAQAIAFGLGGFLGTVAIDLTRWLLPSVEVAYAAVFGFEAVLFLVAAALAMRLVLPGASERIRTPGAPGLATAARR